MDAPAHVVLVGGGHAAAAFVNSVRRAGYSGALTLISDEPVPPYHRPPLSKKYLAAASAAGADPDPRRAPGTPSRAPRCAWARAWQRIDREARCVVLDGGERIGYDRLVLLTGARPRRLPAEIGGDLQGVLTMRSLADADALAPHLVAGKRVAGGRRRLHRPGGRRGRCRPRACR